MRKWRGLSHSEIDLCWKNSAERVEKEVLDTYKFEESKREAFRGRGASQKWRRVRKNKKYRLRKWREERLLGKNFLVVQRIQLAASAKQAGGVNGRRRDEAAAKNGDHERSDKENQVKREKLTLKADGGFLNCWLQTVRKRGSTQDGRTPCRNGKIGWRR